MNVVAVIKYQFIEDLSTVGDTMNEFGRGQILAYKYAEYAMERRTRKKIKKTVIYKNKRNTKIYQLRKAKSHYRTESERMSLVEMYEGP